MNNKLVISYLFNDNIHQSIVDLTSTYIEIFFIITIFSFIGSIYFLIPMTLYISYKIKSFFDSIFFIITFLSSYIIFRFLKNLFAIERPEVNYNIQFEEYNNIIYDFMYFNIDYDSYGFPSGHAFAVTVFGLLFIFRSNLFSFNIRKYIAFILIVTVSFSRVLIGVHNIGDIIGGIMFGIIYFIIALLLSKYIFKKIYIKYFY